MTDELDRLDSLIGDVARGLTAQPPREDFAQRVAMRVAGEQSGRDARTWMRAWLLVPAAAACVLALAVFLARETRRPEAQPSIGTTARSERVAPPAPAVSTGPRREEAPVRQARRLVQRPAADAVLPENFVVAPLAVPAIDIAPLARGEIVEIAPIAV